MTAPTEAPSNSPSRRRTARRAAGGCDFALDPRRGATEAEVLWLPRLDPRVVRLMGDPTGSASLGLSRAPTRLDRTAHDGRHILIGTRLDPSAALVLPGVAFDAPLAAIVPLDDDTLYRIDALLRLWRKLMGQPPGRPAADLTAARRKRLAMMLRAVDARRTGATRREIAEVLFGPDNVPDGAEFDDHHLRSRTTRLIRDGLAMIAGGYRKLLKD